MDLEFRHRLGSGASGEVWLANDLLLNRLCAVKFFTLGPAAHGTAVLEGQALSRVDHYAVVRVFALSELEHPETGKSHFAATMEYVDGISLDKLIGGMGAAQASAVVNDLLDALEALHQSGVVHSDLHAGNVLITARGGKLIDPYYMSSLRGKDASDAKATISSDVRDLANILRDVVSRVRGVARHHLDSAIEHAATADTVAELRDAYVDFITPTTLPPALVIADDQPELRRIENQSFSNRRIHLCGYHFRKCTFTDCKFIFTGDSGTRMESLKITNSTRDSLIGFSGPAATTLNFLMMLRQSSDWGYTQVGIWLNDILKLGPPKQSSPQDDLPCPCGGGQLFGDCHGGED